MPCGAHIDEALQPLYMQGVHAAVIVADLTDLRSFIDITRWITLFTSATSTLPFPVLLLANKADSPDRVLSDTSVAEWAERHRITHSHVVSAKTGAGVEEAFRSIVNLVERFVPVPGLPVFVSSNAASASVGAGNGNADATQRLLSLLHAPGAAAARRSPSHSPSPSNRTSVSITPTSRTSSILSHSLLLSTQHPAINPRIPLPSSSPRFVPAAGVTRSPAFSHSALAVQRLTAAGNAPRSPGDSVSMRLRGEAREREVSWSGSRMEEKEAIVERKAAAVAALGAGSSSLSVKPPLFNTKAGPASTAAVGAKRMPLHSPSHREVDLRF